MSTQDPYGPSDPQRGGHDGPPSWQQSERTGSSPAGGGGQQPYGGQQSYGGQPHDGQQHGAEPYGYGDGRPARRNGMGVAALVLGIIALLFFWTIIAGVLGLVALVLGIVGSRRAKRGEATNRGVAITGAVLGLLGLLGAVIVLVIGLAVGSQVVDCYRLANQGASEEQVQQCVTDQLGIPASTDS